MNQSQFRVGEIVYHINRNKPVEIISINDELGYVRIKLIYPDHLDTEVGQVRTAWLTVLRKLTPLDEVLK